MNNTYEYEQEQQGFSTSSQRDKEMRHHEELKIKRLWGIIIMLIIFTVIGFIYNLSMGYYDKIFNTIIEVLVLPESLKIPTITPEGKSASILALLDKYPSWYSYFLTTSSIMHGICVAAYGVFLTKQQDAVRGIPRSFLLESIPTALTIGKYRIYTFALVVLIAINAFLNIPVLVIVCWGIVTYYTIKMLQMQYELENEGVIEKRATEYIDQVLEDSLQSCLTTGDKGAVSWQELIICINRNRGGVKQIISPNSVSNDAFVLDCLYRGWMKVNPCESVLTEENESYNSAYYFYNRMVMYVISRIMRSMTPIERKNYIYEIIDYLEGLKRKKNRNCFGLICFAYFTQLYFTVSIVGR